MNKKFCLLLALLLVSLMVVGCQTTAPAAPAAEEQPAAAKSLRPKKPPKKPKPMLRMRSPWLSSISASSKAQPGRVRMIGRANALLKNTPMSIMSIVKKLALIWQFPMPKN